MLVYRRPDSDADIMMPVAREGSGPGAGRGGRPGPGPLCCSGGPGRQRSCRLRPQRKDFQSLSDCNWRLRLWLRVGGSRCTAASGIESESSRLPRHQQGLGCRAQARRPVASLTRQSESASGSGSRTARQGSGSARSAPRPGLADAAARVTECAHSEVAGANQSHHPAAAAPSPTAAAPSTADDGDPEACQWRKSCSAPLTTPTAEEPRRSRSSSMDGNVGKDCAEPRRPSPRGLISFKII